MVLFIATQHCNAIKVHFPGHLFGMCSVLDFIHGSYRCRSDGAQVVFADFFRSTNLHMTHSKHQLNRSTKAILSDIIQFEAPVPFPCYH